MSGGGQLIPDPAFPPLGPKPGRPSRPGLRIGYLLTGILLLVAGGLGIAHVVQGAGSGSAAPRITPQDRATCGAALTVMRQYVAWSNTLLGSKGSGANEAAVQAGPPIGPAMARLRALNAQTRDATLHGSVHLMVTGYAEGGGTFGWLEGGGEVIQDCTTLGLAMTLPSDLQPPTTT
jgi:hypothetical protein